ncbi:MAG: cobyric acid synthase CobQ, partial [Clostridiaceae bacterium]|nr:cobyric acid synthase CobQ [Clostridiaceae bacterium]
VGLGVLYTCQEGVGELPGMGLLPLMTRFGQEKTRTRVEGYTGSLRGELKELSGKKVSGYEIHMGQSVIQQGGAPLQKIHSVFSAAETEKMDGCYHGHVLGTYLHGIFDEEEFRRAFVQLLCRRKGIAYKNQPAVNYQEYKEQQFDKLAEVLRRNLDMEEIYRIMGLEKRKI